MSEWTQGAQEYLDGYLRQVGALARENGDDAREIVEQLRDHVNHEAAALDAPLITVDMIRRVLAALGTPETVVSGDWSAPRPTEPPRRAASAPLPPTPAPQTVVIQERKGCSRGCLILAIIVVVLFLGLPVLGILWGITAPAVSRSREAARRAQCAGNLKLIASVLAQYQAKNGMLPPLSRKEGELMFDEEAMQSDIATLKQALNCPSRVDAADSPGDDSYLYLPYHLTTPGDVSLFSHAYLEAGQAGVLPAGQPLVSSGPEGAGTVAWVGNFGDGPNASTTPLIVERPHAHIPGGCNVLYLDGHVEFVKMGQKFPVLPEFFNALAQIDMLDGDASLAGTETSAEWAPVQR